MRETLHPLLQLLQPKRQVKPAEYTLAGKQQAAKRAARWLRREMTKGQTDKPPSHIAEKLKIFWSI